MSCNKSLEKCIDMVLTNKHILYKHLFRLTSPYELHLLVVRDLQMQLMVLSFQAISFFKENHYMPYKLDLPFLSQGHNKAFEVI